MGVRITQAPVETLADPGPNARITQAPIEVLVQNAAPKVRITQAPVEVTYHSTVETVRITQAPVEVLWSPGISFSVTQLALEILADNVTAITASDSGTGSDYLSGRTIAAPIDMGIGVDTASFFGPTSGGSGGSGSSSGGMGGQIEDLIGDAINTWMRDITRDARELTYSASDPSEIASYTSNSSIDHTGWAYITVPTTTAVRITTEGSSVADTLLFLYGAGVVPSSGSVHIAMGDDIDVSQEPTLTGVSYSVKWSRIDITLAPGTYYICVLPKDGSAFDWTLGKDLLLSVRQLS